MLDPICIIKTKQDGNPAAPKTMVRFCRGSPILITGDIKGNIDVYRLNSNYIIISEEEDKPDAQYQQEKLIKLLYTEGYNLISNNTEGEESAQVTSKSLSSAKEAND